MAKILLKFCGLCSVLCGLFLACATTPTVEDLKKAEAYYKLGVSYLNENKLRESFIEFQKAISLNQEDKYSLIFSARSWPMPGIFLSSSSGVSAISPANPSIFCAPLL